MSSLTDDVPDYRQIAIQKLYDASLTVISKTSPDLTPAQQSRLARYVAEEDPDYASLRDERGWSTPPESELTPHIEALAYLKLPDAECYRVPPSVGDLERAIIAAENITAVTDRMTLHRELQRLSPDELLERSRGLTIVPADTPKLTAAPKNAPKAAHLMNDAELFELVGKTVGRDPHTMLPSKIREIGTALVEASRPKQTPALDALRAKLASGKQWQAIPIIERVTAERESRDVLGKSLRELRLGP